MGVYFFTGCTKEPRVARYYNRLHIGVIYIEKMTIRYVEVRRWAWADAADELIRKLKEEGVKEGQILYIDAHINDRGGSYPIFSAYWDDAIDGRGSLYIDYYAQNTNKPWERFYKDAADFVAWKRPEDIISITGSTNTNDKAVLYVFYYPNGSASSRQKIKYCESRNPRWAECSHDIIANLKNNGAKAGQVISIDAHQNGPWAEKAIFHAFWNESLPPYDDEELSIESICAANTDGSWDSQYQAAVSHIQGRHVWHGITSSCNGWQGVLKGVTFLFKETDKIVDAKFFLNEYKDVYTKPKFCGSQINENRTSSDQNVEFSHTEQLGTTSTFAHEHGCSIEIGTTIKAGIPFFAEAENSFKMGYQNNFRFEETTTEMTSSTVTVPCTAKPGKIVTCRFFVTESQRDVPYRFKYASGRESSGYWKHTQVFNLRAEFTEESVDLHIRYSTLKVPNV